ncbi:hypothetical protein [Pseudomonas phage D6]|nr:hypothetical protein [Pseudomonas phage D6]
MDYIAFCDAVDAAALRHVSEVMELRYLDAAQARVYVIGRVNEDLKKLYPAEQITSEFWFYADPHDIGTWDYYVATQIRTGDRAFVHEIMIRRKIDSDQYNIVKRERALIVQFQERVQQYATTEFKELSGNSTLNTAEFINQLEERIAGRLADYYGREGFEVMVTAHIGLGTSYTVQAEDPIDGASVTLELAVRVAVDDTPEQYTLKVEGESKDGVFELKTLYQPEPEVLAKHTKVQLTLDVVKAGQDKLADLHFEYEKVLGEPEQADYINADIYKHLLDKFGADLQFSVNVETTADSITVWIEESTVGVKTRLRSTRKLENKE